MTEDEVVELWKTIPEMTPLDAMKQALEALEKPAMKEGKE